MRFFDLTIQCPPAEGHSTESTFSFHFINKAGPDTPRRAALALPNLILKVNFSECSCGPACVFF